MRYKAAWAYDLEEEVPEVRDVTIHEADEWIDTGLLDVNGNRLYRSHKVAMGIQHPVKA